MVLTLLFLSLQAFSSDLPAPRKMGLVLVFLSAKCPCSDSHITEISELSLQYTDFKFAAIHSNSDETPEQAMLYFKNAKLPFEVITDQKFKLADQFDAYKTPHSVIILPNKKIAYSGGVTDSSDGEDAEQKYLREALDDISKNKPIRKTKTEVMGCLIRPR